MPDRTPRGARLFVRRTATMLAVIAAGLVLTPGTGLAQVDCNDLPKPSGYIVDQANVVDDSVEAALTGRLQAYESATGGNQVAALVVSSIGDEGIEDYANNVFGCWGVGKEGDDTGVLLVVAIEQRRLRIEVGRGLEGDLTDVQAADIIRDVITPRFRAGDVSGGVRDGVDGIVTVLGGGAVPVVQQPVPGRRTGSGSGRGFGLFFLLVVFAVVSSLANRGRRGGGGGITGGGMGGSGGMWLPILLGSALGSSGRSSGGWTSGGGGFGGGGGGFGGFGGGGSGGGGASGGW
ncbi:MAG TPA: TPM domain-containing protein [Mycobacteriales bacterium]|nr:TPM domain-containing protein [Mycobacteriales bacterium]